MGEEGAGDGSGRQRRPEVRPGGGEAPDTAGP